MRTREISARSRTSALLIVQTAYTAWPVKCTSTDTTCFSRFFFAEELGFNINTTWHTDSHAPPAEKLADHYYSLPAPGVGESIISLCRFLTPGASKDWPRWHACVSGSFAYWMSHMFRHRPMPLPEREEICPPFKRAETSSVELGIRSYALCMGLVKLGYLSYPRSRQLVPDQYGIFLGDTKPSWDEWFDADIHDEEYRYFMAPYDTL